MMFHVEQKAVMRTAVGMTLIFCFFLMSSCRPAQSRQVISDYVILRNGKSIQSNTPLNAFVFEDKSEGYRFKEFVELKANAIPTLHGLTVSIIGEPVTLAFYNNDELDKYFVLSDFIVSDLKPKTEALTHRSNFVAVSAVDSQNRDCLSESSLFYQATTDWLKKKKDEFNNQ